MLLDRCDFGKDDYSLNIVNLPQDEAQNQGEEEWSDESEDTDTQPGDQNKNII